PSSIASRSSKASVRLSRLSTSRRCCGDNESTHHHGEAMVKHYRCVLESSTGDASKASKQRTHRALRRDEFGEHVGGYRVALGFDEGGDARRELGHGRGD